MTQNAGLFRQEAVDHASRKLAGDVILATPLTFRIVAAFAVAVAAVTFASLATYARNETVVGWVAPDQGIIRLAAREGGVLDRIIVTEGEEVERGHPIAVLRHSPVGSLATR